jgi:hypothetical protein
MDFYVVSFETSTNLDEHRLVVKKIALEKVEMPSTTANFERLVDVMVFLGLSGMLHCSPSWKQCIPHQNASMQEIATI